MYMCVKYNNWDQKITISFFLVIWVYQDRYDLKIAQGIILFMMQLFIYIKIFLGKKEYGRFFLFKLTYFKIEFQFIAKTQSW